MSDSQQPEEVLLHCRIFDIIKKYQIGQSGKKHERFVVRHPGGVAILPVLSENEVVLIRQYRSAVDQYIYELPAGNPGEGGGYPAHGRAGADRGDRVPRRALDFYDGVLVLAGDPHREDLYLPRRRFNGGGFGDGRRRDTQALYPSS